MSRALSYSASTIPLTPATIAAAERLYANYLSQWRAADAALAQLRSAIPQFTTEANLIKVATLNTLYGTNLRATHRMAAHINDVMNRFWCKGQHDLVDAIAAMPLQPGEPARTHRSFASKFAHFFIDQDRYPILDGAACDALKLHLGRERTRDIATSYKAFIKAVADLRREYSLGDDNQALDRYLWIVGMYLRFARGDREINRDLLALFSRDPRPSDLAMLVSACGQRAG